jgi:hypothetical protein
MPGGENQRVTGARLLGRKITEVRLDQVPDGFAAPVLDDGSTLEIRTSAVGHLLLSLDPNVPAEA